MTWAFLFEDQPYFDGFRDLATNGIDKAVLNAFRMLGHARRRLGRGDERPRARHRGRSWTHGVRGTPDVNAVATRDDKGVSILAWHYHDDDVEDGAAKVVDRARRPAGRRGRRLRHYRMDEDHSNAFGVWKAMGSPQDPSGADYARLEAAGQLETIESKRVEIADGRLDLTTDLPRQGVSLIRLDW